jgi:hypothetical protein
MDQEEYKDNKFKQLKAGAQTFYNIQPRLIMQANRGII